MNIRNKMFVAMAVMIVLICSTFIQISLEFLSKLFDRYVAQIGTETWTTATVLDLRAYLVRWMAIGSSGGAIFSGIVAFLIGYWLVRTFTKPLEQLGPAVEQIANSDFQLHVPVTTKDEFGTLIRAFNQMTQRLQHAEDVRKRLVADVAHELRTPLAIIQSRLEYIQENGQLVAPETLLPIHDEVLRLTGLVDDLHQLTLADAGGLPLNRQPTDLIELLCKVVAVLQPEADERRLTVSIEPPAMQPISHVDPDRMMQVFYNLLSNGVRYTMPGGSVTVRITDLRSGADAAAMDADLIRISITDTGIGIAPDQLPLVFNRFHRIQEARSRHAGGMGLGLAIAKEFVEAHGGSIDVKSEVGHGTEFVLLLPALTAP